MRGGATAGVDPSARGGERSSFASPRQPSNQRADENASSSRDGRERLHELALLAEPRDALRRMPARIEQHVGERVPHLLRRLQHAQVIALEEHRPGAPERPVHRAREPRRKRHHPAPERLPIVGLDDQMRVIVLDRVVDEPEVAALAGLAERRLHLAHDAAVAKRLDPAPHLQRDERRQPRIDPVARPMAHPRVRPRPPPRPRRLAEVTPSPEPQLGLLRSTHR